MSVDSALVDFEESPRTILDRYELVARLGSGGMARVFLALQRNAIASKLVVVKEILPEYCDDEIFRSMFLDEARIALSLSHPNVVTSFEVIADRKEFCLVMEYLEGRSLSQLLRRVGRASMPQAVHLWLLAEVLKGLHYTHELVDLEGTPLHLVHRDVSPVNTVITTRGEVKLVDFGIAKAAGALTQTSVGTIKGKVAYASPEQLTGDDIDARSDVYAVGVMLWEALASKRRVKGREMASMVRARLDGEEQSLDECCPGLPRELVAITERALAVDKEARFPTAEAMRQELTAFLANSDATSLQDELAKLVREHFAEELARTRAAVEQAMANRGSTRATIAYLDVSAEPDTSTPGRVGAPSVHIVEPPRKLASPVVAGTVGGAVVVAGLVFWNILTTQPEPERLERLEAPKIGNELAAPPPPEVPAQTPASSALAEDVAPDASARPSATLAPRPTRGPTRWSKPDPKVPAVASAAVPQRAPSATPAQQPAPALPGADLRSRKPSERQRSLDEQNPFGQ